MLIFSSRLATLFRNPAKSLVLIGAFGFAICSTVTARSDDDLAPLATFAADQTISVDHGLWDEFLKTHVKTVDTNRTIVTYGDVTDTERKALSNYLTSLAAIDPATLTKAQAYAYWVNFYNAATVNLILENYPLKSIRRIGLFGPWKRDVTTVNGIDISLDDMEKGLLLSYWDDPRTHYAVNCASYGCPNLQPEAFTAENTEALLERGAREYVNSPRGVKISDGGSVTASTIYKWYQDDFGGSEAAVLDHIRQYADDQKRAQLEGKSDIDNYEYDWALNEK